MSFQIQNHLHLFTMKNLAVKPLNQAIDPQTCLKVIIRIGKNINDYYSKDFSSLIFEDRLPKYTKIYGNKRIEAAQKLVSKETNPKPKIDPVSERIISQMKVFLY